MGSHFQDVKIYLFGPLCGLLAHPLNLATFWASAADNKLNMFFSSFFFFQKMI